jgi:hypothetical protein
MSAQPAPPRASERRRSSLLDLPIVEELAKVPKRKLAYCFGLAMIASVYVSFGWTVVGVNIPVNSLIWNILTMLAAPLAAAKQVFPDREHSWAELGGYLVICLAKYGVAVFDSMTPDRIYHLLGYGLCTGVLFMFMHCMYGRSTEQPATWVKYLVPIIYALYAIAGALGSWNESLTSLLIAMMAMYTPPTLVYLLAADTPIDKARRGVKIHGDGFYFAVRAPT